MTGITTADLENAKRDADDLGKIVGGAANINGTGLVPTRVGGNVRSVRKVFQDIEAQADTEIAATSAAIITGVADDTEVVKRRARWDALLAQFASGKIPRGLFDFADHGIDDWVNVWNVLLFWTGSVLWPLAKIDATFNENWVEGDILHQEPNGDMYHSVSWAKMRSPAFDNSLAADLVTLHVRWDTGHDDLTAGRGETAGNPFRSLDYAAVQAKTHAPNAVHIIYYGDMLGLNAHNGAGGASNIEDGQLLAITFVPDTLTRTWCVAQREGMTQAMWAFAEVAPGVWKSTSTTSPVNDAMKKSFAQVDALVLDDWGRPRVMKYLGGAWATEADAIAAVLAQPGSFAWYGTTGGGLGLYVHLFDGREPDPANWWMHETTQINTWYIGDDDARVVISNLGRFHYDQGTNSAALRFRALNIDLGVPVVHANEAWFYNCAVVGASGPAVQIQDIARGGVDHLVADHTVNDVCNYHSYYTGFAQGGDYMHMIEAFVLGDNIGWSTFGNPTYGSHSNQVTSAHDQIRISRFNVVGGNTDGAPLADVGGVQSWAMAVYVSDPRQADNGPPGDDSPAVNVWADSAMPAAAVAKPHTKMRLVHCGGKVKPPQKNLSVTNGAAIEYSHWIGPGPTSQSYGAGTSVTDVTPA
jgi:hypothetical protein